MSEEKEESTGKAEQPTRKLVIPSQGAKVVQAIGCTLLVVFFFVVGIYAHTQKSQLRCTSIVTNVHQNGQDVLITDRGLRSILNSEFPELKGSLLSEIDYNELERQIERLDVVKRCEAYPTIGGAVHIEIYQRRPIMRVFSTSSGSYYMDEEGYKMTAIPGMRTHTLIVNGSVNSMIDYTGLIELCRYINGNSFWRAMIEQVFVTKNHEYVLIPRVGNHTVEFGTADNMAVKFDKLSRLYKGGWEKTEWNVYSKVDLRYEGQIVCTKR